MLARTLIAIAFLLPGSALACGSTEQLAFSCTTTRGTFIEVCQAPSSIHFSWRKKKGQKPEVESRVSNSSLLWTGEGDSQLGSDDLFFPHGKLKLNLSITSNYHEDGTSADLFVFDGYQRLSTIRCESGTVNFARDVIKANRGINRDNSH